MSEPPPRWDELPEDLRSPRDRIIDAARAAPLVLDPQQRRLGVLGLMRERLRLGRFGDLTAEPEFVCTITELIAAAYPDDQDVYWSWVDAHQPAVMTGIGIELVLAIHAAPEHELIEFYQRTLMKNALVRQKLFRPGSTLRQGLLALAADSDYGFLVCQELRDVLRRRAEPAPQPQEALSAPAAPASDRTGAAGRPTSKHLVMREWERIVSSDELLEITSSEQARVLAKWLTKHHPGFPPMKFDTIQRYISRSFADHAKKRKASTG